MDAKKQKIVEKSMKGDRKSLLRLLEVEGTSVLYMCVKLMGNQQDGEDAAQEVFLKIQKNISKLQVSSAYPVWVNRIIVNTCLDIKKHLQRKMEATSLESYIEQIGEERKEFLPIEYAEQKELREKLLLAIDSLQSSYKTVILLYYYENFSQKEISGILEISENAVSHRLRRARNEIERKLQIEQSKEKTEIPFLASIPVVTRALEIQCESLVTPAQIERLISTSKSTYIAKDVQIIKSSVFTKVVLSVVAVGILVSISAWVVKEDDSQNIAQNNGNERLIEEYTAVENSAQVLQGQFDITQKPAISVKFSNSDELRSNVNPTECVIEIYGSSIAQVAWKIKDLENDSLIAEGTELKIENETLKIDSNQDVKQYILYVTAKAETGEISKTQQIFTVVQ